MTIPAILNDLLDYEEYEAAHEKTYIWVKKGKKEEAWAVCALLGLIVDGNIEVDGHPVANTYIFTRYGHLLASSFANKPDFYTVGVEGRFHLRDLQTYFDLREADNASYQPNQS